jgi:hypothetical protein
MSVIFPPHFNLSQVKVLGLGGTRSKRTCRAFAPGIMGASVKTGYRLTEYLSDERKILFEVFFQEPIAQIGKLSLAFSSRHHHRQVPYLGGKRHPPIGSLPGPRYYLEKGRNPSVIRPLSQTNTRAASLAVG